MTTDNKASRLHQPHIPFRLALITIGVLFLASCGSKPEPVFHLYTDTSPDGATRYSLNVAGEPDLGQVANYLDQNKDTTDDPTACAAALDAKFNDRLVSPDGITDVSQKKVGDGRVIVLPGLPDACIDKLK